MALEGWLYETARLTALSFLRGERRRQFREQEAYMQSTQQETADDSVWQQLAPLLDEGMARLRKKDRDAIVLRFFKERSVREVAGAMQVSEAAAQRRVLRALEKLRKYFVTRGVGSTASAIAGAISAHSVHAAPPAFANSVTPHISTDLAFSTNYSPTCAGCTSDLNTLAYETRGDSALTSGYYAQAVQDFGKAIANDRATRTHI